MFALLTDPHAWAGLATLTALEIILGIDNVIFLSIVAGKLPAERRPPARRIGLAFALLMRIALLSCLVWIIHLSKPVVTYHGIGFSWRDLIFAAGGFFLLTKGTRDIHGLVEGEDEEGHGKPASFANVVFQIVVFDLIFSIDSVVTAVGMAEHLSIMIGAVILAVLIMLAASAAVAEFVARYPTVKMLALSFLLLIGTALIADAMHFHIPRGYLYAAIAFSALVEVLNQYAARAKRKRDAPS